LKIFAHAYALSVDNPVMPAKNLHAAPIPLLPIGQASHSPVLHHNMGAIERFGTTFENVLLREPPASDPSRWISHSIGGVTHRFAQPLTLTPYAAVRPCSARCRFCSETLRDEGLTGQTAAALRPGSRYFAHLRAALALLEGVPLSYSLSGLESTDDPDWLLELLTTLDNPARGPNVEDSVMYSNGAGLVEHADRLLPALAAFGLSAIEWSRHHDAPETNQRIMRFRAGQRVAAQNAFQKAVEQANASIPVRLVCVVQQGGIATPDDVMRYIDWAHGLGVASVIFREFSELPASYRDTPTRRYIDRARVSIEELLQACMTDKRFRERHHPQALTSGYYFWNARWQASARQEVIFEKSNYATMLAHESSGLVYKLVFHANAHLCAGWQPNHHVLWRPHAS
jgi:hypothetical protein